MRLEKCHISNMEHGLHGLDGFSRIRAIRVQSQSIRSICVYLRLIFDTEMQKIGSGMERMRIVCDEQNCPYPEVDYTDTHFYLSFNPSREYLKMSEVEKPEVEWEYELNERQKKAIDFVKENGKITNSDYRNLCNVSTDTAHKDLRELVEKNVLIREGSGRSTYYRMIVG